MFYDVKIELKVSKCLAAIPRTLSKQGWLHRLRFKTNRKMGGFCWSGGVIIKH